MKNSELINNTPLVSVLMTAYNRERYIAEAIESVITSSYQHWELIIVDDQSTDRTVEIALEFEQKDSRIRVYINEKNLGDYPNRNMAASYAKGKYLKYLDSDDVLYSYGLETMVNAMEGMPDAGIGFADYWNRFRAKKPILISPRDAYTMHYFGGGLLFVGPSGSIYKREYFETIGGFDPKYKVATDNDFNLKSSMKLPVVCFQNDLFWYRSHEDQEIHKRKDEYENLNYLINYFYLQHNESPLSRNECRIALNNTQNILARRALLLLAKLKIKKGVGKIKSYKITFTQLILCFIPSKIRRRLQ